MSLLVMRILLKYFFNYLYYLCYEGMNVKSKSIQHMLETNLNIVKVMVHRYHKFIATTGSCQDMQQLLSRGMSCHEPVIQASLGKDLELCLTGRVRSNPGLRQPLRRRRTGCNRALEQYDASTAPFSECVNSCIHICHEPVIQASVGDDVELCPTGRVRSNPGFRQPLRRRRTGCDRALEQYDTSTASCSECINSCIYICESINRYIYILIMLIWDYILLIPNLFCKGYVIKQEGYSAVGGLEGCVSSTMLHGFITTIRLFYTTIRTKIR